MISSSDKDMLLDIEKILQNPSIYSESDLKDVQLMKDDIINDIQKELLESRRKKINKIMNIPELPHSIPAEIREKIEKAKKELRENKKK